HRLSWEETSLHAPSLFPSAGLAASACTSVVDRPHPPVAALAGGLPGRVLPHGRGRPAVAAPRGVGRAAHGRRRTSLRDLVLRTAPHHAAPRVAHPRRPAPHPRRRRAGRGPPQHTGALPRARRVA